jgi:hypothetical protein
VPVERLNVVEEGLGLIPPPFGCYICHTATPHQHTFPRMTKSHAGKRVLPNVRFVGKEYARDCQDATVDSRDPYKTKLAVLLSDRHWKGHEGVQSLRRETIGSLRAALPATPPTVNAASASTIDALAIRIFRSIEMLVANPSSQ